jgi:hypothetical protein
VLPSSSPNAKAVAYLATTGILAVAPLVIWRQYSDNHGLALALVVSIALSAWIYLVQLPVQTRLALVASGLVAANWVAIEGLALFFFWSVFGFGP